MAMPRSKAPPARFATAPGRETGTAALVANDLRHHSAVVVEEAVLNRLPATEPKRLRVDREQRLRLLEPVLAPVGDRSQDRAVARVAEHLLRLRRPEELEKRLRLRMLDPTLRQRDRVLDEDRLLWQHVVRVHAFLVGVNRLVLVRQ